MAGAGSAPDGDQDQAGWRDSIHTIDKFLIVQIYLLYF
jgi:hypothetical protein